MSLLLIETSVSIAITSAGVLFLNALLTGVWKFKQMMKSPHGLAHRYVDIAHRASLMYSFACILLAVFVWVSQLAQIIEISALLALIIYFMIAVISYMIQGLKQETDNVMAAKSPAITWFMVSLILVEISGFIVIFYGMLDAIL